MTTVTIERIATGGDGVGRLPDGMTVFVPRTAPGDEVEIAVVARQRRWARARLVRLISGGPDRVPAACPHYDDDSCGGCQLQHLSLASQHEAKARIVQDVLTRVGRRPIAAPDVVAAPAPWRYRTRIAIARGAGGELGFHRLDRPGDVFDLRDCHIARSELMTLLARVRGVRALLPSGVTQLVLRLGRSGGMHLVVRGGEAPWDGPAFGAALGEPAVTVWWEPEGGAARVVAGAADAFPALAFLQTNPELAAAIQREAVAWLGPRPGVVVWDLYGGVGDAARALAALGAEVWSVDADRAAVAWAERQDPAGGRAPRYVAGRVEEVLHRLPPPDVVLLNPPRTGAARRVTAALDRLAGRVSRLAYISCDPATLARDLGRVPAFALRRMRAYDLFPQTAHVETLALLEAA